MDKKANLLAFGNRLKELRKERNLTQAQLAEKVDVSMNFIGMVERGERNTTIDKMFKLAQALEVTLAKFYEKI